MQLIHGEPVILYEKTQTGVDELFHPVYEETPVTVYNVLIGTPSTEEAAGVLNLTGKLVTYQLALPKGDEHDWVNATVEFWGHKFRTVGVPIQGIEVNIPLSWNKKVWVTAYE